MTNDPPAGYSGWDYQKKQAKPTKRLAPTGSVLFLELQGSVADIRIWIQQVWMHCISDDASADSGMAREQYRLDGSGLAVLGAWMNYHIHD